MISTVLVLLLSQYPSLNLYEEGQKKGTVHTLNVKGTAIDCTVEKSVGTCSIDAGVISEIEDEWNPQVVYCAAQCNAATTWLTSGMGCGGTWTTATAVSHTDLSCATQLDTAAGAGSNAGVISSGLNVMHTAATGTFKAIFVTASNISDMRAWALVGTHSVNDFRFETTTPSGSDATVRYAGFRYIAGTDTNWQCCRGTGGVDTCTDSGVAVSTSTPYMLELTRVSGSTFTWEINGTAVCNGQAGWDTGTAEFYWGGVGISAISGAAAKTYYFKSFSFTAPQR